MLTKIKIAGTLLCAMCSWLICTCQVSAEVDDTQILAQIGGVANAVAILGDVGYIGEGEQLTILDLSDVTHPREVRSISLSGRALAIEIADHQAYILLESAGIKVFDLLNPAAPQLLSHFQQITNIVQIKRGADWLYALAPAEGSEVGKQTQSIYILDDKKRLQLELIGIWTVPFRTQNTNYERSGNALIEQGNYVYLTTQTGLAVVDKTSLNAYNQIAFLPIDAKVNARNAIEISDTYAFIRESAFFTPTIYRLIDISNPYQPVDLGDFKVAAEFNVLSIKIIQHFAFITGYDYIALASNTPEKVRNDRVDVYDIRDPKQPVVIKQLRNLAAPEIFKSCPFKGGCQYKITHAIHNIALSDSKVMVSGENGVGIFSFSPALPDKLVRTAFFSTQYAHYDKANRIEVKPESDLYAVIDANSIQLVNFSNPSQPLRKVGYTAPADQVITSHWIATDTLYVATAIVRPSGEQYQLEYLTSTLSVFSIGLDATFAPMGQLALPEPATSIVVANDLVYVAAKHKIFVVDAKTRRSPEIVVSLKLSDTDRISDMKADHKRFIVLIAFAGSFAPSRLRLYSLSNSQQPSFVREFVFDDPFTLLDFDAINLEGDFLVLGIRGNSNAVGGFDPPQNPTAVVILNIQSLAQPISITNAAINVPLRIYFETIATSERLSLLSSQNFIYAMGFRNYILKKDALDRLIPVFASETFGKPLWVMSKPTHEVVIAIKNSQLQFVQLNPAPKTVFLPLAW